MTFNMINAKHSHTVMALSDWQWLRPRLKKMGCIGLCESVHIAQRQITRQIPIEFCILVIGLGLGLGLGHCQSDRAIIVNYIIICFID